MSAVDPGAPPPVPWLTRRVLHRGLPHPSGGYDRAEMTDVGMRYSRRGLLHRVDGPACTWPDGSLEWYRDGRRHREGGPAVEYAGGRRQWWLDGVRQPDPQTDGVDGAARDRVEAAAALTALEAEVRDLERELEARRRDLIRARVRVAEL